MNIDVMLRDRGLWININRPDRRNALTEEMFVALTAAFERAAKTDEAKYVLITGTGRDFCAGGDIGEFDKILGQSAEEQAASALSQFGKITVPWFRAVLAVPQPIVVAARGNAIGAGAQLLFAADLVLASDTLKIALPQVKLGHTLDHGESVSLARKVGLGTAMEMALLGDPVDAAFALRTGLVNRIVEDGALDQAAADLAMLLGKGAGLALRETKALLRESTEALWEGRLRREGEAMSRCAAAPDFREAILAFSQKRRPEFQ